MTFHFPLSQLPRVVKGMVVIAEPFSIFRYRNPTAMQWRLASHNPHGTTNLKSDSFALPVKQSGLPMFSRFVMPLTGGFLIIEKTEVRHKDGLGKYRNGSPASEALHIGNWDVVLHDPFLPNQASVNQQRQRFRFGQRHIKSNKMLNRLLRINILVSGVRSDN